MDTLTAIKNRRAVKHYDPDHVMPEEDERTLLEHALLSPTSFNVQHWRIVNVKDNDLREQIKEAAWSQAQITEASMLLVLTGDVGAWNHNPERYWHNAPQEVQDILVPMIRPFYEGKPELQRDEAVRSLGIAGQTIMLAAKAMGYDSCPMIGFDADAVAKLINLPENHVIGMMIAVGKATKPANPRGGQLGYDEVVITDRF